MNYCALFNNKKFVLYLPLQRDSKESACNCLIISDSVTILAKTPNKLAKMLCFADTTLYIYIRSTTRSFL